jgi:NADH-quinone oxidoreductase subunit N
VLPLADIEWKDTATLKGVFTVAAPETVLLAAACVIYLGGAIRAGRNLWGAISLVAVGAAALVAWNVSAPAGFKSGDSPVEPDALAYFIRGIAYVGGAVLILLSWNDLADEQAADYFATLLILIGGLSLLGPANELVSIFLSLELVSIPTYVLLYLPKAGNKFQEATLKYFLLSIFSSGLLLFGFSYLYGASGTTNLTSLLRARGEASPLSIPGLFQIATVMVIAGIGFRITAVPFHFYAPDVIQGAPTSLGALLAFVPKVAGFTALIRLLGLMHPEPHTLANSQVVLLLWLLAVITMTVGNVLALLQDNLKRLLAYSSVAHGGYMLMAVAAAPTLASSGDSMRGLEALLFYLVTYGAMTVGAFAVISYLTADEHPVETVDDLGGLGRSRPGLALTMALFLFSLIGIPLTAGFIGKLLLFMSALAVSRPDEPRRLFVVLAIVAAVNAAIAAYYYLRIVAAMFLREPLKPIRTVGRWPTLFAIAVCAALTLVFGLYPTLLAKPARQAITIPAAADPQQASR